MPQLVLDPAETAGVSDEWTPTKQLPTSVIDFGFVPDVSLWRPGDLLLFDATRPSWLQRYIKRSQARFYLSDHARWHHAAVYIGRSRICEATVIGGVKVREIYDCIPGYRIRVRRCPLLEQDLDGSYDVAVEAMSRLGQSYSLKTIVRLWWRIHFGVRSRNNPIHVPGYRHICSGLYADSYSQSTRRVLHNGAGNIPMPAQLSASDQLKDVDSRWRRLTA